MMTNTSHRVGMMYEHRDLEQSTFMLVMVAPNRVAMMNLASPLLSMMDLFEVEDINNITNEEFTRLTFNESGKFVPVGTFFSRFIKKVQ